MVINLSALHCRRAAATFTQDNILNAFDTDTRARGDSASLLVSSNANAHVFIYMADVHHSRLWLLMTTAMRHSAGVNKRQLSSLKLL